ncbi:MAG: proton-conducting transporter membrane subunit [Zestosphaera sp.]
MHSPEPSLIPFICLMLAALVPLTSMVANKKLSNLIALLGSIIIFTIALRLFMVIESVGVAVYRFGGFPAPLGVVYVFDQFNSFLAVSVSFALVLTVVYVVVFESSEHKYLLYSLIYLLMAGVYGCLFTGDVFNFYVSIELAAMSSYALTGFYRGRKAVRAAIIYGIAGTAITSFLLLACFILYGSYGTLNIADIALKSRNVNLEVEFSGGVFGDILLPSKISLALITWIFLFKSGIIPNHFWLPEAYLVAPLPAIVLFTTSADILGIYGIVRLYYLVFSEGSLISDFRATMLGVLFFLGTVSAVIASMLVANQRTIRKLIAYSSISQFSLSLLGVASGTAEGLSGSILHLVVNGLGDASVLYSVGILKYYSSNPVKGGKRKIILSLARVTLIVGLINLFGVIPIVPGFWSKALLVLGLVKAGMTVATIAVLASTGLCAIGYFSTLMKILQKYRSTNNLNDSGSKHDIAVVASIFILASILMACLGLGIGLTVYDTLRDKVVEFGYGVLDSWTYIKTVIP